MGKKLLIGFIVVLVVFTVIYALVSLEVIKFETAGSKEEEEPKAIMSVEDLDDGKFYVWHDNKYSLEHDLEGAVDKDVFRLCPEGKINWKKKKDANHTIWFSTEEDVDIPTLFPGDQLIYISRTNTPGESNSILDSGNINWERFYDFGYSIGVANLELDKSGHYYIEYDSDHGYEGCINSNSNAKDVADFKNFKGSQIYLDKVGNIDVREGLVSAGGTILGLDKDADYLCKWYKGTYVSDFKLTSNMHVFSTMESFVTTGWEFKSNDTNLSDIHSCITISIPEDFKSGYYYIEETGLFRYVSMEDISIYDGKPYDPNVNWNDPIILYDDHGLVIYDPFQGIDDRGRIGAGNSTSNGVTVVNPNYEDMIYNSNFYVESDPEINQPDPGAEEYEEFDDEEYYEEEPETEETDVNTEEESGEIVEDGEDEVIENTNTESIVIDNDS